MAALPDLPVDRIDGRGMHIDHDIAGSRDRICGVPINQHFRPAIVSHLNSFHRTLLERFNFGRQNDLDRTAAPACTGG